MFTYQLKITKTAFQNGNHIVFTSKIFTDKRRYNLNSLPEVLLHIYEFKINLALKAASYAFYFFQSFQ